MRFHTMWYVRPAKAHSWADPPELSLLASVTCIKPLELNEIYDDIIMLEIYTKNTLQGSWILFSIPYTVINHINNVIRPSLKMAGNPIPLPLSD